MKAPWSKIFACFESSSICLRLPSDIYLDTDPPDGAAWNFHVSVYVDGAMGISQAKALRKPTEQGDPRALHPEQP